MEKRRKFTCEFKLEAVRLINERSGNVWDNGSDGELLLLAQDRTNGTEGLSNAR